MLDRLHLWWLEIFFPSHKMLSLIRLPPRRAAYLGVSQGVSTERACCATGQGKAAGREINLQMISLR